MLFVSVATGYRCSLIAILSLVGVFFANIFSHSVLRQEARAPSAPALQSTSTRTDKICAPPVAASEPLLFACSRCSTLASGERALRRQGTGQQREGGDVQCRRRKAKMRNGNGGNGTLDWRKEGTTHITTSLPGRSGL